MHQNIQKKNSLPKVVLVGRMNVGKSTLFNRLTRTHGALVSAIAGTTRDRREGIVTWNGHSFILIDTGGIDLPKTTKEQQKQKRGGYSVSSDPFAQDIERQATIARREAALVLFVVDGREGLLPQERAWARLLKKEKKSVLLAVNKLDAPRHRHALHEFWILGCGEPAPISAITGSGTGDLLDRVVPELLQYQAPPLPEADPETPQKEPIRIALLGKPNVGKSSLVNALLGEDRVIVSPIAHTTREPIDTHFTFNGQAFVLIDTAGIRRKAHIDRGLEETGVELSLKVLERADVALIVLESHVSLNVQDLHLARALADFGVGCLIVANKWDLFLKKSTDQNPMAKTEAVKKFTQYIRNQLPHLDWAPMVFASALTKRNVNTILDTVVQVDAERRRMISEKELEEFMKKLVYRPSTKVKTMRKPHVYGLKQTGTCPPKFELVTEWTNVMTQKGKQKGTVRSSYVRFIENQLRDRFGFEGTPVIVQLRTIEQ